MKKKHSILSSSMSQCQKHYLSLIYFPHTITNLIQNAYSSFSFSNEPSTGNSRPISRSLIHREMVRGWCNMKKSLAEIKTEKDEVRGSYSHPPSSHSAKYLSQTLTWLSWQPTVPSWEKEFCSSVCRIPWRKICETKRVMSFYKNIVEWNDSAGEEALHNAKTRFWAEINGLPCDISLPDPDIYIDAVDWNSYIDPELLLDLDREPPVPDVGEKKDGKLGFLDSTLSNQPIICTGWDDTDYPVMEANIAVGPGCENYLRIADNSNVWGHNDEENKVAEGNSWQSGWGDYSKNFNNINNAWESSARENRIAVNNSWNSGWGQWDNYDGSADNSNARGQYAPRSSRFHGDYCQTNGGWRNDKGRKRASFVHERPIINKRPLASWQWNSIQSCGPMYQDKSTQSGNQCNWEKPVS